MCVLNETYYRGHLLSCQNELNLQLPMKSQWPVIMVILHFFKGIDQEGIFRLSGNPKIMEKLRNSFDRTGDADVRDVNDIMAIASLLKLYLRELPDGLIPDYLTPLFVTAQNSKIALQMQSFITIL